jgi:hypothetical protein
MPLKGIGWNRLPVAGFEFICAVLARILQSQSPFEGQLPHSSPEQICLAVGGKRPVRFWRGQERFALVF